MKYCGNCRNAMQDHISVCPRCGLRQPDRQPAIQQPQQRGGYPYPQASRVGQPPRGHPDYSQPARQPSPQAPPPQAYGCPRCGAQLRFIKDYNAYYCDRCLEYQGYAPTPAQDPQAAQHETAPQPTAATASGGAGVDGQSRQGAETVSGRKGEGGKADDRSIPEDDAPVDVRGMRGEQDEKILERKISAALKRIKTTLKELDTEGHDVSELEELYRQTGNAFASEDFYTATHYIESIQKLMDKMPVKDLFVDKKAKKQVKDVKIEVDVGMDDERDYDVEFDTDGVLETGAHGFENGAVVIEDQQGRTAGGLNIKSKPEIGDKDKAIQALESAKSAITTAAEDGYDTTRAKEVFRQARPFYEANDFKSVIDKARDVEREVLRLKGLLEEEIEEILGSPSEGFIMKGAADTEDKVELGLHMTNEERRELIGMINKVWIPLREASRYGLDTSGFEALLEQAKSKRTYHQANVLVTSVETEVKNKLENHKTEQHDKASNMFHYIRSEITSAERMGLDVQPFQDMLENASTGISMGNWDDAIDIMENCLTAIKTATKAGAVTGQVAAGKAAGPVDPVCDAEDEDEGAGSEDDGETGASLKDKPHKDLTDEERLKILKDRFILGEISEASYRELKNEILKRMERNQ